MNKKQTYVLVAVVIVVLVIIGLLSGSGKEAVNSEQNTEGTQEQVDNSDIQEEVVQDRLSVTHEAIGANDISVCMKLTDESEQNLCEFSFITQQAKISDDVSLCNELEEGLRVDCEEQVYTYKAITTKDPSLCEKVTNLQRKEQCLVQSAE